MNALANTQVADYLNENYICTFLKVGTFQIINGQKVGGNVASYFCLADGSVSFLADSMDLTVLQALSTISGGETASAQ